jgi:hypothetical protein
MCRIIDENGNRKKSLKFFWITALPYVSRQKAIKGFTDLRSSFKAFVVGAFKVVKCVRRIIYKKKEFLNFVNKDKFINTKNY